MTRHADNRFTPADACRQPSAPRSVSRNGGSDTAGRTALTQDGSSTRTREPEPVSQLRTTLALPTTAAEVAYRAPSERRGARSVASHTAFALFTLVGDLGVIFLGTTLPALIRFAPDSLIAIPRTAEGAALLGIGGIAWISLLSARGAYWPAVTLSRMHQVLRVAGAGAVAWVIVQLLAFWLKVSIPLESRLVVALSFPATILGLTAYRLLVVRPIAKRIYGRQCRGPVLVFGDSERSMRIADEMGRHDRKRRKVFHHTVSSMTPGRAASLVDEHEAGEVIIDPDSRTPAEVLSIAFACLDAGAEVRLVSAETRMIVRRPENGGIGGLPLMRLRQFDLAGPEVFLKRLVDLVGAGLGLLVLSPFLALIAIAVKLSSPGPVIYRQERVGHRGTPFQLFKFRTMKDGNDSRASRDYLRSFIREGRPAEITADGTMIFKQPRDPRVTGLGAWLRRLSIDELPQLYNVLLGEMSLVGPRPCLPYEWELYEPWQRRRLDVMPGCTGLWQVTGRSRVRFEDMVILDLYYAHHGTLLSDLRLIAQTIPVMAQGRGAY